MQYRPDKISTSLQEIDRKDFSLMHPRRRVSHLLLLCALLPALLPAVAPAQPAFLVKDINTAADYPPVELGPEFTQANGLLFFSTDDGIHGSEMWRSDGTATGTFLLADACPGLCTGFPSTPTSLGGNVYFTIFAKLWKSDGTAAGTVLLADIWPGIHASDPAIVGQAGGIVFFSAADPIHGRELWKTDGTAAGTALVKDLDGGSGDSFGPFPDIYREGSATVGNRLYFRSGGFFGPKDLWVTDGTAAGTSRIDDLVPGSGPRADVVRGTLEACRLEAREPAGARLGGGGEV
jgi:ELWxxDGT repeat protein